MARTTKKAVSTDTNPVSDNKPQEVVETQVDILAQMKAMMDEINSLRSALAEKSGQPSSKDGKSDDRIDGFRYVPIMSLYQNQINFTTEEHGRGKKYTLDKFGDVKNIIFNDLANILNNHPTFFEKGWLFICDPVVVEQVGFKDIYNNILRKETLEKAISGKADALMIYNSANAPQKAIIRDFLIAKARDYPETMDMKFLIEFKRETGIDIMQMAEDSKELMLPKKE
jgi:hypothetical protein